MTQAVCNRLPFIVVGLSPTATASAHCESTRPFQNRRRWKALLIVPSELTSVQPAPIETLPGIDVTSAPPRASSWQLTHEMPVGCPLGARAGDDGRPSASTCVAGPEKRGSKNILCPSATASRL